MSGCDFCAIAAGDEGLLAGFDSGARAGRVVVFEPLGPRVPGHVLVVPAAHVVDAGDDPGVYAMVSMVAATWAKQHGGAYNLITSSGREATQTVFHLHVHAVPRKAGDRLQLPWTDHA